MRTLCRSPFMGLFDDLFEYSISTLAPLFEGYEHPKAECEWKETDDGYKLCIKGNNVQIAVQDKDRTLTYRVRDCKKNSCYKKDGSISFPEDAIPVTVKATRTESCVCVTVKKNVKEEPKLEGREIHID